MLAVCETLDYADYCGLYGMTYMTYNAYKQNILPFLLVRNFRNTQFDLPLLMIYPKNVV